MIAELPLDSWILLILSAALGLSLELAFFLTHRRERRRRAGRGGSTGRGGGEPSGGEGRDPLPSGTEP